MNIESLLLQAFEKGASDIHLASGKPFSFRIDGHLYMDYQHVVGANIMIAFLKPLMSEDYYGDDQMSERDFVCILANRRCRINYYINCHGPAIAIRPIPDKVPTLTELGLATSIAKLCYDKPHGLILVVGATGSGKTTTLAAMIDEMNRSQHLHILTIEDPIEFRHSSIKCLVNQRQVGVHTASYPMALRHMLRQDPDVVLIGEVRDLATIRLALTAAETGHLVLTTLHAYSAIQAINRIIDVFPGDEKAMIRTLLSHSLRAIIAQQLVKKATKHGRVAVQEIMKVTPAIQNMIRQNTIAQIQSVLQTSQQDGMMTMGQAMKSLKNKGII